MIDLYALTSPNVKKIIIALEELALPYQLKLVNVYKGEHFSPEYIKINPNSKIPAIVDHDGPGGKPVAIFESGAILIYLAEKAGRLLPKEGAARYEVLEWMMIQMTGVGPNFGQWVHFNRRVSGGGNEYSISRFNTEVRRLYEVIEARLGKCRYFGGSEYSIADIAMIPFLRDREDHGITWDTFPNLARWFADVTVRPGVLAAEAKAQTIEAPKNAMRATATSEDLDRFYYRRGKFAKG